MRIPLLTKHSRVLLPLLSAASLALAQTTAPQTLQSRGNPILADGSYYSADPAPLVAGDTLYILAGRDEAPPDVNDFIMNEWQIFATKNVASGKWLHYPGILKPHQVFAWASPDRAYAGQIVEGADHRFYLYAPVQEASSRNEDTFAIGVAVSDSPLGPWRDAHPSGPIVSQSTPEPNHIQNIDPTAMVDDDGRVWLYWGTFGRLLGMELKPDMITPAGKEFPIHGLTGFFEAPWIMKRNSVYYMIYAGNQAGPHSVCTPAVYHACIEYGTAPAPTGPWTWQGVILDPVSSTTSHPGAVEFKGQWYLVYHTADARGGGHFRRSVAIDKMAWDDTVTPARIRKIIPTHAPTAPPAPSRNLAPAARASASNEPVPLQYWIAAVNDGIVRANPLPPDMWATWTPHNPPQQWLQYTWSEPVTLDGSRIVFWADHPAGANEGVTLPKAWHLEYWHEGAWHPVAHPSGYPSDPGHFAAVSFDPVTTRCLRAVFDASGDGNRYAAVAVEEWEALAPKPLAQNTRPQSPENEIGCSNPSDR